MDKIVQKWLCSDCKFLLGYVENKTVVRIKRKDLYVHVQGGDVTMNCCRCGKTNRLQDDSNQTGDVHLMESTGKEE